MKKNIDAVLEETLNKLESEAKGYTERMGFSGSHYAAFSGTLKGFIRGLPDCKEVREYLRICYGIESKK